MSQIACRLLEPGDARPLIELLARLRPTIVKLSGRLVYRAITVECFNSKRLTCLVAVRSGALIGYVLAARDWRRFQREFVCRHPLVGIMILGKKLWAHLNSRKTKPPTGRESPAAAPETNLTAQRNWEDSGMTIAKILHVGVDQAARSKGTGAVLYSTLRRQLEKEGVARIDARIETGNMPSVRLHERSGWTVVVCPGGYFATIDLTKPNDERVAPDPS